jgi:hypothetical protein
MILPAGTTVVLRQNKNGDPYEWNFNNRKPVYVDTMAVVLRESKSEVVVQLKDPLAEAYIPRLFFTSKGSNLKAEPPIVSIPGTSTIETLPL